MDVHKTLTGNATWVLDHEIHRFCSAIALGISGSRRLPITLRPPIICLYHMLWSIRILKIQSWGPSYEWREILGLSGDQRSIHRFDSASKFECTSRKNFFLLPKNSALPSSRWFIHKCARTAIINVVCLFMLAWQRSGWVHGTVSLWRAMLFCFLHYNIYSRMLKVVKIFIL